MEKPEKLVVRLHVAMTKSDKQKLDQVAEVHGVGSATMARILIKRALQSENE
jgi:hypothetical protein